jgi:hypothetical protein
MQGDAGHPGWWVVNMKKNNGKQWRAEEEERHMGSLTKKN